MVRKTRIVDQHGNPIRYAASKVTRGTGDWMPARQNTTDLIGSTNPRIRERIRQLVRDFPYFRRGVDFNIDFSVGTGFNFQSRAVTQTGKPDKRARKIINKAWAEWIAEADSAGIMDLDTIHRLCRREELQAGEYVILKRIVQDRNRTFPFSVQVISSDWFDDSINDTIPIAGAVTKYGVEYNSLTGQRIRYHLKNPDHFSQKSTAVPADQIIHGFEIEHPMQIRGISPFVSAVLLAHDLRDRMDIEMEASKMAAKWVAFRKSNKENTDFAGMRDDENITTDTAGRLIEEIHCGTMEYLNAGEEVEMNKVDRPGSSFEPYIKLVTRLLSVGLRCPYQFMANDVQGLSFSNMKGIFLQVTKQYTPIRDEQIKYFCDRVFAAWLEASVLGGVLPFTDFFQNRKRYLQAEWIFDGIGRIDDLRESKANETEMNNHTLSAIEILRSRGKDPVKHLDEIKEWEDLKKERGLENVSSSTALGNNPAKLGANENEDEEDEEDEGDEEGGGGEDENGENNQDERTRRLRLMGGL